MVTKIYHMDFMIIISSATDLTQLKQISVIGLINYN